MIKSKMTKDRIRFRGFHQKMRNRTNWRKGITVYHPFSTKKVTRRQVKQARFSQLRKLALRKECACVGSKFVSFDTLSEDARRAWMEGC